MNFRELSRDTLLVSAIQDGLTRKGYLDPNMRGHITKPHDGIVGPATENAIRRFYANVDMMGRTLVDEDIPPGLIAHIVNDGPSMPDLSFGNPASKIIKAMLEAGHYVSMCPEAYNIVYIEGVNEDFTLNDNALDGWNDLSLLIGMSDELTPRPIIVRSYVATTGPGKFYTEKPMNPMGASRIAFGQYKSWVMGRHNGSQPALQQCYPVQVHRDLNKDGKRAGDKIYVVPSTINQHTTAPSFNGNSVGKWSAGCLVRKNYGSHMEWLELLKGDPRYDTNKGYVFMSTIMDGKDIFSPIPTP